MDDYEEVRPRQMQLGHSDTEHLISPKVEFCGYRFVYAISQSRVKFLRQAY